MLLLLLFAFFSLAVYDTRLIADNEDSNRSVQLNKPPYSHVFRHGNELVQVDILCFSTPVMD